MFSSWVEISKSALQDNIRSFRANINPETKFAAIVKSNAYGHGMELIARLSLESGADLLGVNSLEEAEQLHQAFPKADILVMGEIPALTKKANILHSEKYWVVVSRIEELEIFQEFNNRPKIHLKTDTGMGRLGYSDDAMISLLDEIKKKGLSFDGIMTHFASTEDFTEHSYSQKQLNKFKQYISHAEKLGFQQLMKHAASSASTMLFKEAQFDMVRVGISLYGLWPSIQTRLSLSLMGKKDFLLNPVLTWKTRIVHIQDLPAGSFIGYGSTYKTTSKTKIGVLPVGYFEGLDRKLSNQGYVLINGERAKIVGRICMNMTMVDITPIPDAKISDEAVIIGKSGNEYISADDIALMTGTINYEVVTRIHQSLPRIIVE